jgi:hypothetical protein
LLDVGILPIFYSRAIIQRTIVDSPAFLEHGSAEKIAVCAHTNRDLNKQEVGFIFYEAAQNSDVLSNIQN